VKTVFTTHATTVGRSITTNEKPLYDYFEGYHGDQMAQELHVEAKHSIEKQTALAADVLTTVSAMTDRECLQFFGRKSDLLLPNGFESSFVPKGQAYVSKRRTARQKTLQVANALLGTTLADDTVIVSTSGRNDYRCKGFDLFVHAMKLLQDLETSRDVLAIIAVPCWKKEARRDLQEAMLHPTGEPLQTPCITHWLYNMAEDRILNTIKGYGLRTGKEEHVHVVLVPTYLDGQDGIFNLTYYDWLIGNDLCIYPSYYEPWGYTPLESAAFGIPCITTDLSGFGQWVDAGLHHEGRLADGIEVMHRTDSNSEEVARQMAAVVQHFADAPQKLQKAAGKAAQAIARKAQWKNFIKNYYKAYETAGA
jgi:glycosyltransferase involved in cell wall biosynthesis